MISNSHVRAPLFNGCTPTENEVHVWRSGLDCPPDDLDGLHQILSLDERERADRFKFVADRMQYVIGRSLLRILLGHCLAIPARSVSFEYGAAGKPYLAAGNCPNRVLNFNVSHSGDVVLVALAYNRAIGIDVELVRSDFETGDIAEQFFSERERTNLAKVPAHRRHQAFFACWTRKEAYLKARGEGLNLPLNCFDVSFMPEDEARLVEVRDHPEEALRWTLHDFNLGPSYRAALAIEGAGYELRCWEWLRTCNGA